MYTHNAIWTWYRAFLTLKTLFPIFWLPPKRPKSGLKKALIFYPFPPPSTIRLMHPGCLDISCAANIRLVKLDCIAFTSRFQFQTSQTFLKKKAIDPLPAAKMRARVYNVLLSKCGCICAVVVLLPNEAIYLASNPLFSRELYLVCGQNKTRLVQLLHIKWSYISCSWKLNAVNK
jgi:hypothetical protein